MSEHAPVKTHEAKGYVASLDGLRGLAAFGVVLHHIDLNIKPDLGFRHGYLAVPFFFTLSGFVIARSYEQRLAGGYPIGRFMLARLVRLLPMIWLGAVLSLLLGASWGNAGLALIVVPAFLGGDLMFPANPPEWSLFFEVAGNLLYALVSRRMRGWWLLAAIATSLAGLLFAALHEGTLSLGYALENSWGGALLLVYSFSTGVFLQHLDAGGFLAKLKVPFVLIVIVSGACVLFRQSEGTLFYAMRDFVCVALIFPAVVFAALRTSIGPRTKAVCAWAGDISYPLYLIHFPIVIFAIGLAYNKNTSALYKYLSVPVMLVFCVLAAWACLELYDKPVRGLLGRWLKGKPTGTTLGRNAGRESAEGASGAVTEPQ